MVAFTFFLAQLARRMRRGWGDPEFRGLFWSVLVVLLVGTVFYHWREGWSWLDSFYFTVVTLATVGYGDFSPTRPETKLFTVLYIIMGLGLLSAFIVKLAGLGDAPGDGRPSAGRPSDGRPFARRRQAQETTEETAVSQTAVSEDNNAS